MALLHARFRLCRARQRRLRSARVFAAQHGVSAWQTCVGIVKARWRWRLALAARQRISPRTRGVTTALSRLCLLVARWYNMRGNAYKLVMFLFAAPALYRDRHSV